MSTGILRPLDHLAPDAARRLMGARYGGDPAADAPGAGAECCARAQLAEALVELGISPDGTAGVELLDMAFREGLMRVALPLRPRRRSAVGA